MSIRLVFRLFSGDGKVLPEFPQKSGFERVDVDMSWIINDQGELVVYYHELELADAVIGVLERRHPQLRFRLSCLFQGVSHEH